MISALLQGVAEPDRRLQQSGVRIRAEDERKHPACRAGVRQICKVPDHSEHTDGEDDEKSPRRGFLKPVLSLRMKKKRESKNDYDEEERNSIYKNHGESPLCARREARGSDAMSVSSIISLTAYMRRISRQTRAGRVFFSPAATEYEIISRQENTARLVVRANLPRGSSNLPPSAAVHCLSLV